MSDDLELVAELRAGSERAFATLVDHYSPQLLRLATAYVQSRAAAEDVVQETWLAVLRGIDEFEARSSVKTWLFAILTNCARTRAAREGRSLPFASVWSRDSEPDEPSVEPDRFLPADDERWPHMWTAYPSSWGEQPEQRLVANEARRVIDVAIAALPPAQREVITLRDVVGCDSGEVCDLLGLSEGNQRVLLHRARSSVRRALERYVDRRP